MKKLLGISLVAVLATTPLMAMAETQNPSAYALVDGENDGGKTAEAGISSKSNATPVAEKGHYFAGKSVTDEDAEKVATGAYVKGAYNAAISAVNALADETTTALAGKQNNLTAGNGIDITGDTVSAKLDTTSGLAASANGLTVDAGNGIELDSNGVSVKAKTNGGIVVDAQDGVSVSVDGTTVGLNTNGQLEVVGVGNFATKTGVVNTIESSYVEDVVTDAVLSNNGVTALTTWGNDAATSTLGAASLTVTRENKAVKVANSGTAQDPVYYRETALNLGTTNPAITPATEVKTTPDANAAWAAPNNG